MVAVTRRRSHLKLQIPFFFCLMAGGDTIIRTATELQSASSCPARESSSTKGQPTMTKKDMVRTIAGEMGLQHLQVQEIVQRVFDGIIETLVQEGRIELRKFGVFAVKKRKPRLARNPKTGEKVSVPERLVVSFKPGLEMQERVGQLKNLPNGK
jgi:nucleoid DNA-binding protein